MSACSDLSLDGPWVVFLGPQGHTPTEVDSLTVLEARGPKSWCRQHRAPSEVSTGEPFLPRLASGGPRVTWLGASPLQPLALGSRVSVSMAVASSIPYKDTGHSI